jgi:hypothetical protein
VFAAVIILRILGIVGCESHPNDSKWSQSDRKEIKQHLHMIDIKLDYIQRLSTDRDFLRDSKEHAELRRSQAIPTVFHFQHEEVNATKQVIDATLAGLVQHGAVHKETVLTCNWLDSSGRVAFKDSDKVRLHAPKNTVPHRSAAAGTVRLTMWPNPRLT